MTFTVSMGWWLAPALVTAAAFGKYWWWSKQQTPSYGYGRIGDGIGHALVIGMALIVSLSAWLIWALLS